MNHLTKAIAFTLLVSTTIAADEDYFGRRLWQVGQFRQRGKVNWRMPVIDVLVPQDGQVGILRPVNEHGNVQYFVINIIDEWTVTIGVAVPGPFENITGATVGSAKSTRGNLLRAVPSPTRPEIDAEFICRMPTSGLSNGEKFNPNRLFCVSGIQEQNGKKLLELELLYAPHERKALSFVSAQLRENRIWSDSTGNFKVPAKLIGLDEKIRLEKSDGKVIEIERQKLSDLDLAYISREESKLGAMFKVFSTPVTGTVQDDVYRHVYAFNTLEQLESYWRSEPINPDLTEEECKTAGVTLIPVASKVEVIRTYRITDNAVAIEVTSDGLGKKSGFIIAFDFVFTPS